MAPPFKQTMLRGRPRVHGNKGRDDLIEIRFMVEHTMRGELMTERRLHRGEYVPTQSEMARMLIREALDRRADIRKAKSKRFIDQALEVGVPLKVVE